MKRILVNLMMLLGATFGLSALTASDAVAGDHGKHLSKHERKAHHSRHDSHFSDRHSNHNSSHYYRSHTRRGYPHHSDSRTDHYDHRARYERHSRNHADDHVIRIGVGHVHDAHCGHSVRYDGGHAMGWLFGFGN